MAHRQLRRPWNSSSISKSPRSANHSSPQWTWSPSVKSSTWSRVQVPKRKPTGSSRLAFGYWQFSCPCSSCSGGCSFECDVRIHQLDILETVWSCRQTELKFCRHKQHSGASRGPSNGPVSAPRRLPKPALSEPATPRLDQSHSRVLPGPTRISVHPAETRKSNCSRKTAGIHRDSRGSL